LAEALGVSRTTVSRALRDDPKVAEATRKRVREAAQAEDYRPDAVLSSLAANRWRALPEGVRSTLALLNLSKRCLAAELVRQAREVAADFGYALDVVNQKDYPNQDAVFRVLRARGIRAVLLWSPDDPDFDLQADVSAFSLLAAPVGMKQLPLHTVSAHHYRAGRLVTRKLAELGFRRPGLVIGLSPRNQNLDMVAGAFRAEWERRLFEGRMPPVLEPRWNQDRFLRWLERHRPDVLVSAAGIEWVLEWLGEAGLRVPEDVPVATVFGNEDQRWNLPGAYLPRATLLRTALHQLNALAQANERGLPTWPVSHLIEPCWREA